MILVTGARGNVGSEVVRALVAAGEPVKALTRDPHTTSFEPLVEVALGDLNTPGTLDTALAGVDGVFLLPGYEDMPGLAAAFANANITRVVLLSGSSAESRDESNAITGYMIRSERAVRDAGIAWTILRPSAFMSNTLRWAPQIAAGDVVRGPWPDVKLAMIDPRDIGEVAAATLLGTRQAGEILRLTGPVALTPSQQVAVLADILGRSLRFEPQTDAEARAEMASVTPAEYVDAFFDFYSTGSLDESTVTNTVAELLGRPPRTLKQWASLHARDFQ